MKCRDYKILISAQLDGQIRPSERALLTHHLNECAACCTFADDLQAQSLALSALSASQLPAATVRQMQESTVWALQIEARKQLQLARERAEQKINWRIKIFSQSFATVMSCLLFLMLVTSILRPAHRALSLMKDVAQIAISPINNDDEEIAQLKDLLLPLPPSPRPILDPRGTLIGFSKAVPDEEFAVIALVNTDGKASVKQVIEAPHDPAVINKLSDALGQQANFKPAFRDGKYKAADTILMFSRITIIG